MAEKVTDIKRKRFTEALDSFSKVYLHFVTTEEGVQIPHHLYDQEVVVFVYGHDLPIPISDLDVDGEGVGGTLSFGGSPFYCFVPWKAVLMISTDTGEAWPLPDKEYVDVLLGYLMDRLDSQGHTTSTRHLDDSSSRSEPRRSHLSIAGQDSEEGVKEHLLEIIETEEDGSGHGSSTSVDEDAASADAGPDDDDTPKGPPTLRIIT